jgi:hypothetical protein
LRETFKIVVFSNVTVIILFCPAYGGRKIEKTFKIIGLFSNGNRYNGFLPRLQRGEISVS